MTSKATTIDYRKEIRRKAGQYLETDLKRTLWIGNLPHDVRAFEIRLLFESIGEVRSIDVESSRRSSKDIISYVKFYSKHDAKRAARKRNGCVFGGRRIRVEFSRTRLTQDKRKIEPDYKKKSAHRVWVQNIPSGTVWQDLKDFFRSVGSVRHADVIQRRFAAVDFAFPEDVAKAVELCDKRTFELPNGKKETILVSVETPKEVLDSDGSEKSCTRGNGRVRSRSSSFDGAKRHRRSISTDFDYRRIDSPVRVKSSRSSSPELARRSSREAKRNKSQIRLKGRSKRGRKQRSKHKRNLSSSESSDEGVTTNEESVDEKFQKPRRRKRNVLSSSSSSSSDSSDSNINLDVKADEAETDGKEEKEIVEVTVD